MATIFPTSPAPQVNDEYQGYRYNGTSWEIIGTDLTADYQPRVTNVSDTEIGYLNGVTSSIQTQINNLSGGSSFPVPYLPFVSGAFYRSPLITTTGISATTNTTYYTPFYVGATTSFDRIGCTTSNATVAGTVRLGIYSDTNGKPDALVLDAGTISYTLATTAPYLITINQSLTAGWYWLAFNSQSGTSTWLGTTGNPTSGASIQRMYSNISPYVLNGFIQLAITGALPSTATPLASGASSTQFPYAYLRAT